MLEEIDETSAALRTAAGPQADKTLSEIDGFVQLLQPTDEQADHE